MTAFSMPRSQFFTIWTNPKSCLSFFSCRKLGCKWAFYAILSLNWLMRHLQTISKNITSKRASIKDKQALINRLWKFKRGERLAKTATSFTKIDQFDGF